tara:strand:+ start:2561 stop:3505 length:945 start_codon:yes stop_codon:yes gene_type:complete
MSIKNLYKVKSIKKHETYEWLQKKHYAKRLPSITNAYGLYEGCTLIGVCTFGMPASPTLCESIAGKEYKDMAIELNRLCVNEGLPKNSLSYFVSNAIKLIKNFDIIVSFSDINMNHNGYIYQACNFLYTGKTSNTKQLVDKDGNEFHFRNIGHIQNKLKGDKNVKHNKRRINEENINKINIANFLRKYKGTYTASNLDKIFGYKDTAAHWFRLDKGFSFPTVDDWIKLKTLLNFDNTLDNVMTAYELYPDRQEVINNLKLKQIDVNPKHRYIFIKGKNKNKIFKDLNYKILAYPKGQNKRYDSTYKPTVQGILF